MAIERMLSHFPAYGQRTSLLTRRFDRSRPKLR